MTSANVFNLNSVNQGQVLNANAANGKSKTENPDAASVFASLMNGNYSTINTPSVNKADNTLVTGSSAADNFDKYQYRDNTIQQAPDNVIADKIQNSSDALDQFQKDVVSAVSEELGVSEEDVASAMETLGLTVFDLLNPENLAQLSMQLTGETSPMDLLMNDSFQDLMQQMQQLGTQLAEELELTPNQMDELVAQMDLLEYPQELTEDEVQTLTDMVQETDTASIGTIPAQAEDTDVSVNADVYEDNPQEDPVRTQQPTSQDTDNSPTGDGKDSDSGSSLAGRQNNIEIHAENTAAVQTNEVPVTMTETVPTQESSYISVDTMDLLQQVAEQIRVSVSEGTSSMEMQLNPENLGKIYVNISAKEGAIHAQLAASNEAVRAALESQMAELKQNLNQAGVKVDAVEVTVASHEFEKNLEQNQESDKQQGERQQEQASSRRRNLNRSSLDELSGLMTEEETLAAQIMRDNGNSMDVIA